MQILNRGVLIYLIYKTGVALHVIKMYKKYSVMIKPSVSSVVYDLLVY